MTSLVPTGPSNHHQHQQQHQQQPQHQQHHHHQPGGHPHASDGSGGIDGRADAEYVLERIVGTEETLWCPTLGIKVRMRKGMLNIVIEGDRGGDIAIG